MSGKTAIALAVIVCLLVSQAFAAADDGDDARLEIKKLKLQLLSKDKKEAAYAVTRLRIIGSDLAIKILADALKRRTINSDVKAAAVTAIASQENAKALDALKRAFKSTDSKTRCAILASAKHFKDKGGDGLIILGLGDKDILVQSASVVGSRAVMTLTLEQALLKKMNSGKPRIRRKIVMEVPNKDTSTTFMDILKEGLRDNEASVVKSALMKIDTISGLTDEAKLEKCKHIARRDDVNIRLALAGILVKINTRDSYDILAKMLKSARSPDEIIALCSRIAAFHYPDIVKTVSGHARHQEAKVRVAALRLIAGQEKSDAAKRIFTGALKDKDDEVLIAAIDGLKDYKDTSLINTFVGIAQKSEVPAVKSKAAEALLQMPAQDSARYLAECLVWAQGEVRYSVLDKMGVAKSRAFAPAIVSALNELLKDGKFTDSEFPVRAASALRLIGGPEALKGLVIICGGDVKKAALAAIPGLAEDRSRTAMDTLAALLQSKDSRVRAEAVKMIGMTGASGYADKIFALLEDRESKVRRAAIYALGDIGDPQYVSELLDRKRLEKIKRKVGDYNALLNVVGEIGGDQALAYLLETAEGDGESGIIALRALRSEHIRNNKKAAEKLMTIIKSPKSDKTCEAVRTLGYVGSEQAISFLLSLAKKESGPVSNAAVEALGATGDARALARLTALLEDNSFRGNPDVLIKTLVRLGIADAAPLIRIVEASKRSSRVGCVRAIAPLRSERVRDLLINEALNPRSHAAEEALIGLIVWHNQDARCRKTVVRLMRAEGAGISYKVLKACAAVQHKEYVDVLIDLLGKFDPEKNSASRRLTLYALRCITNHDPGDDHKDWVKWWLEADMKPLASIVDDGFLRMGYDVKSGGKFALLHKYVLALYENDSRHHLRANALRRLKSATGEKSEFVGEDEWSERIAAEWQKWWLRNKERLGKESGRE